MVENLTNDGRLASTGRRFDHGQAVAAPHMKEGAGKQAASLNDVLGLDGCVGKCVASVLGCRAGNRQEAEVGKVNAHGVALCSLM